MMDDSPAINALQREIRFLFVCWRRQFPIASPVRRDIRRCIADCVRGIRYLRRPSASLQVVSAKDWSPQILTRVTKHGAMVITIDGDSATAMFREQADGCCIEHELLSDDGETSMPIAEAIRVCDELVEDLDAGRRFDRSGGRRV